MKRDFLVIMSGRMLQVITTIFIARIMTSLLGQEEMGKTVLIMSITTFFALIFINPVGTYINRRLHEWEEKGVLLQRFQLYCVYVISVTLFANLFLLLFYLFYKNELQLSLGWLIFLVTGSLLINTFNQTIIPTLNMLGHRMKSVIFALLTLWSSLFFSVYLTGQTHRAEQWLAGQLIGLAIGLVVALFFFVRSYKDQSKVFKGKAIFKEVSREQLKSLVVFSVPVAITVGLSWVQFQSYRFTVNSLVSVEFLGLFAAGYNMSSSIMGAFETTAMQFFYPFVYKNFSKARNEQEQIQIWNRYAAIMIPLTLFTAFFVVYMAKPLTNLLLDESYHAAYMFLMWGSIAEAGRILGSVYGLLAHASMKTRQLIVPQFIGALLSAVLVPCLIYTWGPEFGVGAALALASLAYVLALHIVIRKKMAFQISAFTVIQGLLGPLPLLAATLLFPSENLTLVGTIILVGCCGIYYLLLGYLAIGKLLRRNSIDFSGTKDV
ncbi:hypothetical protein B9G55_10405 [Saccharibacillus sp. O16]|nr:hypothetical protein B9G55_10405 [Saccharibacillus sp. O16]